MRKPLQGVSNIVRFNWHFYLLAIVIIVCSFLVGHLFSDNVQYFSFLAAVVGLMAMMVSLAVSFYIYDWSGIYKLNWLDDIVPKHYNTMINVHGGFDETSGLLKDKFPNSTLLIFDFYNPEQHTEVSLKRARMAYPALQENISVDTDQLPVKAAYADCIFLFFAAHEVRDEEERLIFFKELSRILKPGGIIVITEHLRDVPNFIAYTFGCFHFYSRQTWLDCFLKAKLKVTNEKKITPFITTFVLSQDGNAC